MNNEYGIKKTKSIKKIPSIKKYIFNKKQNITSWIFTNTIRYLDRQLPIISVNQTPVKLYVTIKNVS